MQPLYTQSGLPIGLNQGPPYQSNRLKSMGNLQYLDFVRLVSKFWMDSHPDIPLWASGGREQEQFPVINYRLDYRKAFNGEPKPRFREAIPTNPTDPILLNFGQRFDNIVTFTVSTKEDPHLAETILEEFENFMITITPVLKELGLSDFFYARRDPDIESTRKGGESRTERSVSYRVVIEKIVQVTREKIQQMVVDARIFLATSSATPDWTVPTISATPVSTEIVDTFQSIANQ